MNQVNNLPKRGDVVDWRLIISSAPYRGHVTCWLGPSDCVNIYTSIKAGPSLLIDIEDPPNKTTGGDVVYLKLLTTAGIFKVVVFSMSFGRVEGSNAIMLRKYDASPQT